jgi:hypothetical protein
MPQPKPQLEPPSGIPATFAVVTAAPGVTENHIAPAGTESANTPGFRFTMLVWFAGFLFLWAMLIWDLVYALVKL